MVVLIKFGLKSVRAAKVCNAKLFKTHIIHEKYLLGSSSRLLNTMNKLCQNLLCAILRTKEVGCKVADEHICT